jgi:hypothetical protein
MDNRRGKQTRKASFCPIDHSELYLRKGEGLLNRRDAEFADFTKLIKPGAGPAKSMLADAPIAPEAL